MLQYRRKARNWNRKSCYHSFSRSVLLACTLVIVVLHSPTIYAQGVVDSLIYDHQSRSWVPYTKQRALQYYKSNGGSPEVYRRQVVSFRTAEKPGTIIIDSDRKLLFLVLPDKKALRYGIGVGKDGFGWAGIVRVAAKQKIQSGHHQHQ